jgi:hypothetical protein
MAPHSAPKSHRPDQLEPRRAAWWVPDILDDPGVSPLCRIIASVLREVRHAFRRPVPARLDARRAVDANAGQNDKTEYGCG